MKIHTDSTRASSTTDLTPASKASGGTAAKATTATAAVGSVSISETSRSLQTAGTSKVEAPFDAKRVEAIKAAISSGQFKVNPEVIADRIVDSASQLLVGKS